MQHDSDWQSPVGCTADSKEHSSFLRWCKRRKLKFPKCELRHLQSTGRCVVATEFISTGEVVVEVPDDCVLMAENCSISEQLTESGFSKDSADEEIDEVQGLVLAVMYEKLLGSKSSWSSYLEFLPDDVSHLPFMWKKKELLELKGTSGYDKMRGKVQHPADAPTKVKQLFQELAAPFLSEQLGMQLSRAQAYRLYCWATAVVASYSFILGDDKYQGMVPMWDMLNHITGRANVRLHHDAKRGVLQMIASADIAAGEELVNNYGPHSNSELLRGYGFVELHNCNENAQVPASIVLSVCRAVLDKARTAHHSNSRQLEQSHTAQKRGVTCDQGRKGASHNQQNGNGVGTAAAAAFTELPSKKRARSMEVIDNAQETPGHTPGRTPAGQSGAKRKRPSLTSEEGFQEPSVSTKHVGGSGEGGKSCREEAGVSGLQESVSEGLSISSAQLRVRMAFCRLHGIIPENGVFKIQYDAGPPPQLTELVRILLLPEVQFAKLQQTVDRWRVPLSRPMRSGMDPASVPLVVQTLQAVLHRMLGRYTCSLEEDEEILQQLDVLPPRLAAAVVARSGEKRCLINCLQWLAQDHAGALLLQDPRSAWQQPYTEEPPAQVPLVAADNPVSRVVETSAASSSKKAAEQTPFLFNFSL